ncbi:glycosyltransferase [Blastococcus sp. TF02A_35]|uniref:glycosyltransferase n=1 Tax=Blastococcus sp. TF02A-35 TaxID=2559612 RepID=UPI0010731BA1|nr:glycosyltransferase [Blastococcus sp. TF02A_35]TFV53721.1 glycosyltransferase [Blastococcus sp. TF02A_35]
MRLVWFTNLAAPYRFPLWQALGERLDLTIALLAQNEHNRHWAESSKELQGVRLDFLHTLGLRRGEATHYFPVSSMAPHLRGADAVILPSWEHPISWALMRAAKRNGARVYGFNESTLMTQKYNARPVSAARARFFRALDGVFTVGQRSTEAMRFQGIEDDRIHEVKNCIDNAAWRESVEQERMKLAHPASAAGHVFLFCGQLVDRKRPQSVLRAFREVASTDDKLVIAGDGPLSGSLQAAIEALSLKGRVEMLGHVPQHRLASLYALGQTLVLPSREEVWGFVATEALAAGLHAVIDERVGCYSEYANMAGVYGVGKHMLTLQTAMQKSRDSWAGPIAFPEIFAWGPNDAAAAIHRALARGNVQ